MACLQEGIGPGDLDETFLLSIATQALSETCPPCWRGEQPCPCGFTGSSLPWVAGGDRLRQQVQTSLLFPVGRQELWQGWVLLVRRFCVVGQPWASEQGKAAERGWASPGLLAGWEEGA